MIAAPARSRAIRSCRLCLHGKDHHHCPKCGMITLAGLCSICTWENGTARISHDVLDPLIHLLQEIFQP